MSENKKEDIKASGWLLILLIPTIFLAFCVLLAEVSKSPTTRGFEDAARNARIAACEAEKGYKNTEDCYK